MTLTAPSEPLRLNPADLHCAGTLTVTGTQVLVGDPCYYDDHGRLMARAVTRPGGPGPADCYVQPGARDGLTARLIVLFSGAPGDVRHARLTGNVGVDGAQMSVLDAERYATQWITREFRVHARYVHTSGAHLDTPGDFRSYDQPLAAYGQQSMNDLLATGQWTQAPLPEQQDFSFPGLCGARDASPLDAAVLGDVAFITGSGYGDGLYPLHDLIGHDGAVIGLSVTFTD